MGVVTNLVFPKKKKSISWIFSGFSTAQLFMAVNHQNSCTLLLIFSQFTIYINGLYDSIREAGKVLVSQTLRSVKKISPSYFFRYTNMLYTVGKLIKCTFWKSNNQEDKDQFSHLKMQQMSKKCSFFRKAIWQIEKQAVHLIKIIHK